jgi:hypothetical protein
MAVANRRHEASKAGKSVRVSGDFVFLSTPGIGNFCQAVDFPRFRRIFAYFSGIPMVNRDIHRISILLKFPGVLKNF